MCITVPFTSGMGEQGSNYPSFARNTVTEDNVSDAVTPLHWRESLRVINTTELGGYTPNPASKSVLVTLLGTASNVHTLDRRRVTLTR